MILRTIRINNFKSIRETPIIDLGSGFNVVVGPNNAGKTALLEAMSLIPDRKPHRSKANLPKEDDVPAETAVTTVSFDADRDDIRELARNRGGRIELRMPRTSPPLEPSDVLAHLSEGAGSLRFEAEIGFSKQGSHFARTMNSPYQLPGRTGADTTFIFEATRGSTALTYSGQREGAPQPGEELGERLFAELRQRMYFFKAERMNIHQHSVGTNTELTSNASNLPEVLDNLQGMPAKMAAFNKAVGSVFPHIAQVSTKSIGSSLKEIRVWLEGHADRPDLAFPLSECGTGVGQVLAMLYVVMTATRPRTIIIDEPNSFLHPGAVRALLEVMSEHRQHQYVVSTHAPAVIEAARPSSIYLLRWRDGETQIEPIDPSSFEDQRVLLRELGVSLSDVFAADRILWVEGKTEELAFPLINAHFGHRLGRVAILGVLHTGDFERNDSARVAEIYRRLSRGAGLMPPAAGFIFDREDRDPENQTELRRRASAPVRFTEYRMFENYLLEPNAVAKWLRAKFDACGLTTVQVSEASIQASFNAAQGRPYGGPPDRSVDQAGWERQVHGANLLAALVGELSDAKAFYDKVEDGYSLTKIVLEVSPDRLRPIADLIGAVLAE